MELQTAFPLLWSKLHCETNMQECLSHNSPSKGFKNKITAPRGGKGDTLQNTLSIFLRKLKII